MPSTESLTDLGVREAADRIRRGEVSSVALVEACLSRVRALEPEVLAWAHVDADGALAARGNAAAASGWASAISTLVGASAEVTANRRRVSSCSKRKRD